MQASARTALRVLSEREAHEQDWHARLRVGQA
jgi:hypothetical protein